MRVQSWRLKLSMNQPTLDPSKEGSKIADARRQRVKGKFEKQSLRSRAKIGD